MLFQSAMVVQQKFSGLSHDHGLKSGLNCLATFWLQTSQEAKVLKMGRWSEVKGIATILQRYLEPLLRLLL